MSKLRKVVVSAAIAGAGLGSLAGVASAHEHAPAKGCSNAIEAATHNGAGRTAGNTAGGTQNLTPSNTCDIFNGNRIGSGNNDASGGSRITNGDTSSTTSNRTSSSSSSVMSTVMNQIP